MSWYIVLHQRTWNLFVLANSDLHEHKLAGTESLGAIWVFARGAFHVVVQLQLVLKVLDKFILEIAHCPCIKTVVLLGIHEAFHFVGRHTILIKDPLRNIKLHLVKNKTIARAVLLVEAGEAFLKESRSGCRRHSDCRVESNFYKP